MLIDVASLSRRYGLAAAPSQRRDSGSSVGSSASGGCACAFLCFSLSLMPRLPWSLCSFKWGLRTLERRFVVVCLVHSNATLRVCVLAFVFVLAGWGLGFRVPLFSRHAPRRVLHWGRGWTPHDACPQPAGGHCSAREALQEEPAQLPHRVGHRCRQSGTAFPTCCSPRS